MTIVDDDTAGVTVVPDTGLSFDEDGTATYTVVLDSQPTGDVIVTVTISVISGATRASYTPSVISGATRASYTPSLISGATRASYTPSLISGATRASYTPSVISGATRASYTPYTPVAADVTEFLKAFVSPDAVTVSPSVLTFTSTNWDTPQTVTVRAMDGIVTDDETIEVSHTVTSADGGYDDFAAAKQTVRTAPLEVDPALSVGRLGLFWDNSTTGNTLWGDSCIGRRSFFVIWTGPEGNNKRADEWVAEIRTHRGAGQVIYDFRETPGARATTRCTAQWTSEEPAACRSMCEAGSAKDGAPGHPQAVSTALRCNDPQETDHLDGTPTAYSKNPLFNSPMSPIPRPTPGWPGSAPSPFSQRRPSRSRVAVRCRSRPQG